MRGAPAEWSGCCGSVTRALRAALMRCRGRYGRLVSGLWAQPRCCGGWCAELREKLRALGATDVVWLALQNFQSNETMQAPLALDPAVP